MRAKYGSEFEADMGPPKRVKKILRRLDLQKGQR